MFSTFEEARDDLVAYFKANKLKHSIKEVTTGNPVFKERVELLFDFNGKEYDSAFECVGNTKLAKMIEMREKAICYHHKLLSGIPRDHWDSIWEHPLYPAMTAAARHACEKQWNIPKVSSLADDPVVSVAPDCPVHMGGFDGPVVGKVTNVRQDDKGNTVGNILFHQRCGICQKDIREGSQEERYSRRCKEHLLTEAVGVDHDGTIKPIDKLDEPLPRKGMGPSAMHETITFEHPKMPFIVAHYPMGNMLLRTALVTAVERAKTSGYLILPSGVEVKCYPETPRIDLETELRKWLLSRNCVLEKIGMSAGMHQIVVIGPPEAMPPGDPPDSSRRMAFMGATLIDAMRAVIEPGEIHGSWHKYLSKF